MGNFQHLKLKKKTDSWRCWWLVSLGFQSFSNINVWNGSRFKWKLSSKTLNSSQFFSILVGTSIYKRNNIFSAIIFNFFKCFNINRFQSTVNNFIYFGEFSLKCQVSVMYNQLYIFLFHYCNGIFLLNTIVTGKLSCAPSNMKDVNLLIFWLKSSSFNYLMFFLIQPSLIF